MEKAIQLVQKETHTQTHTLNPTLHCILDLPELLLPVFDPSICMSLSLSS